MSQKICLALYSGGLDSMLAVKVMQEQGIKVIALNFDIGFYFNDYLIKKGKKIYKGQVPPGFDVRVIDVSEEFFKMIKSPAHGFGKNMNPCIDCKILLLKKAKKLLDDYGASFVITGEVLGQRPMTQNIKAMKIIEKQSGLEGVLLRPLCAKNLQPTIPEQKGRVDREKLHDIQGRARKRQLELAEKLGLSEYVKSPAGGCILTDPGYSKRLESFFKLNPGKQISRKDAYLLSVGRHFIRDGKRFIIGRNKQDNEKLLKFADTGAIFVTKSAPGPVTLAFGELNENEKEFIARATAGYTKSEDEVEIEIRKNNTDETVKVTPAGKEGLKKYMV